MTNEATQGAEESTPIEKTAADTTETSSDQQTAQVPVEENSAAIGTDEQATSAAEATTSVDETQSQDQGNADAAPQTAAPQAAPSTPTFRTQNRVVRKPLKPISPQPAAQQPVVQGSPADQTAATARAEEPQAQGGDIDFGAILEQFEQEQTMFHAGELVTGTVVGVSDRGVLVDFGYKSEGFVPVEEFTDASGSVTAQVGEQVEVVIRSIHSGDGAPQLSRIEALNRKVWDALETAYQAKTPVTGRVVDKTKGGLKIDINGIEAFLPGSQIDSRPIRGLDTYIGQDIEAEIIKFSRRRNNIVLSRKVITDKVINEQKQQTLANIDLGFVVDGTIKNLTEYGAFVDIGGIDGLLHVTDMSWGRIQHPNELFKVGDHVQVKILKLDREKEKISLGYKQLLPDPWSTVVEVYHVGAKLRGKVSSVTDYGVFVELEPGVEGLVHVSEISWSRRAQSPKKMFQKGQEVEVQVLGVDTVEKRISLGMKQFQENPWDMVDIKYPVGSRVRGRVRNLTDFGAFVELEEGIDGLVHVSDISWAKKIKHPKDVLKKDQEVEAVVTNIDKRGQRLSLSMKDLTPSAWEGFVATHRPGDVVRGKVTRFTNFGVFVELEEGLEGLCHISELSDERVDRPESVANIGDEMEFKILRIEPADQKIGLSHRAVGKQSEPASDTRIYSTEAKGGMASLSELANLRFGSATQPQQEEDPEERKRAKKAAKQARADEYAARESGSGDDQAMGDSDGDGVTTATDGSIDSEPSSSEDQQSTAVDQPDGASGDQAASTPEESSESSTSATADALSDDAEMPGDDDAAVAAAGAAAEESNSDVAPGLPGDDTAGGADMGQASQAEGEAADVQTDSAAETPSPDAEAADTGQAADNAAEGADNSQQQ